MLHMTHFPVPARATVSSSNQAIFDSLAKALGMVPNLFATLAHSETALGDYLTLQNRKTTLTAKERETINLVVSQVNGCPYCLSAHTVLGKMNGFTDGQVLELRGGSASFDARLDALAQFVRVTTESRGHPSAAAVDAVFAAGYTAANVIDIVMTIGDKMITNFLHGVSQVPIDFPLAPNLELATA
jgi:uncharacterized peroxidase-related enzyme